MQITAGGKKISQAELWKPADMPIRLYAISDEPFLQVGFSCGFLQQNRQKKTSLTNYKIVNDVLRASIICCWLLARSPPAYIVAPHGRKRVPPNGDHFPFRRQTHTSAGNCFRRRFQTLFAKLKQMADQYGVHLKLPGKKLAVHFTPRSLMTY